MAESVEVHLVEQHIIQPGDCRYEAIDRASFASKNLYNLVNYYIRQAYIKEHRYMPMAEVYKNVKGTEAYTALPRKVSNQVIWQVQRAWGSYYEAVKVWRVQPDLFRTRPKIPGYKPKQTGRNLVVYEKGAISKKALRAGSIRLSGLDITIPTGQKSVDQVRIVHHKGYYVVEVVSTVVVEPDSQLNPEWVAGIDIGLNNLAALTSNKPGFTPLVVNGRPLKAFNQFYNKKRARLQSLLAQSSRFSSPALEKLTAKRDHKINHYLHVVSHRIIETLTKAKISTLAIGKNKNWKQAANLGRRNNQSFVQIPTSRFIDMLTYKAQLAGIHVVTQEESYTSKCSFLDLEPVHKHPTYKGKRTCRGLFTSASGRTINADLNGSYNIIRKAFPNAFRNGIEGAAVHPSGSACKLLP